VLVLPPPQIADTGHHYEFHITMVQGLRVFSENSRIFSTDSKRNFTDEGKGR
jgi:hypothetical protein